MLLVAAAARLPDGPEPHPDRPAQPADAPHPPQLMSLTPLAGEAEEGEEWGAAAGTWSSPPRNSTTTTTPPPPGGGEEGSGGQPPFPWVGTLLASVLITTIVVDIIGNLLVVISVFRNRKLRKAGTSWGVYGGGSKGFAASSFALSIGCSIMLANLV